MEFAVDKKTYELIVASDIERNGVGVELWDKDNNEMLVEIFRNDNLKQIQFFSTGCFIPFEVIEKLAREFEESVGRKFQD